MLTVVSDKIDVNFYFSRQISKHNQKTLQEAELKGLKACDELCLYYSGLQRSCTALLPSQLRDVQQAGRRSSRHGGHGCTAAAVTKLYLKQSQCLPIPGRGEQMAEAQKSGSSAQNSAAARGIPAESLGREAGSRALPISWPRQVPICRAEHGAEPTPSAAHSSLPAH